MAVTVNGVERTTSCCFSCPCENNSAQPYDNRSGVGCFSVTTGLAGCGYKRQRLLGQTPKTYNITLTATNGTIQHSVNVILEVQ
jgi:hypothetical protein